MTKRKASTVILNELQLIGHVFGMVVSGFMAISLVVWGCQWLDKANKPLLFLACMLGAIVFGRLVMLFRYWANCKYTKIKQERKFWN